MSDQSDSAVLLTFVTTSEDGSHKINLYGTPEGLRALARELIRQADVDQTPMKYLGDHDTDHTHYRSTHASAILSPSSDEVQMGRVDLRDGKIAYWAKDRIAEAVAESGDMEQLDD